MQHASLPRGKGRHVDAEQPRHPADTACHADASQRTTESARLCPLPNSCLATTSVRSARSEQRSGRAAEARARTADRRAVNRPSRYETPARAAKPTPWQAAAASGPARESSRGQTCASPPVWIGVFRAWGGPGWPECGPGTRAGSARHGGPRRYGPRPIDPHLPLPSSSPCAGSGTSCPSETRAGRPNTSGSSRADAASSRAVRTGVPRRQNCNRPSQMLRRATPCQPRFPSARPCPRSAGSS